MGIFSRRTRAPASITNASSSSSTTSFTPASPYNLATSKLAGRSTPLSSPVITGSPTFTLPNINLKVVIDPIAFGKGVTSETLLNISVNPDESIGAIRREIARVVGYPSIGLFKVSIPQQAFQQARAYTGRYGKSVDLLAQFPAFNLDDPEQLELSLGPGQYEPTSSGSKIKSWFPDLINQGTISIIARPLLNLPSNIIPLTLRAYFAQPPQVTSSTAGPSSLPSTPPPIVVDIHPHTTVDELKSELLRAAGKNQELWRSVILWKIEMTESEMTVIDELGRLKNGKMPWPYPPGAMEPASMSDGNLPVSLFFPKSAPNGDMLNISIWLNPTPDTNSAIVPPLANEIPHFRYPMTNLIRPASSHCLSPFPSVNGLSVEALADIASSPNEMMADAGIATMTTKIKKSRIRPSTAPASVKTFGSGSSIKSIRQNPPSIPFPGYYSNGVVASSKPKAAKEVKEPKGLGIITPTPMDTASPDSIGSTSNTPNILTPPALVLDRTSFSSSNSAESGHSVQSLPLSNESQQSLDTVIITNNMAKLSFPSEENTAWISADGQSNLKKSMSFRGGSIRDRLRKVL
ncbi:uncharacterized protein I206_106523 [Kwoniella pini CBS 10737]|uniref:Uncharacterized protein n=1 Tax=Kwoniella pini CBS 10737 TaxID=1296096 RepID=A0A1B9HS85_9TREE|nr:uncharacterized protein I206_07911 [Kwoniella pini CBS 10737]OCF46126.1 hypothetical protein I206_07911 [Kwoniella pini CBS 10737]